MIDRIIDKHFYHHHRINVASLNVTIDFLRNSFISIFVSSSSLDSLNLIFGSVFDLLIVATNGFSLSFFIRNESVGGFNDDFRGFNDDEHDGQRKFAGTYLFH